MKNTNKLFYLLIISEVIFILLLSKKIFFKNKVAFEIDSTKVNRPAESKLHYYLEYNSNMHLKDPIPNSNQSATYTINADSLNERINYQINKTPETYRIITLGDSFTFGAYVDTKDNYSEKLEDLLNIKNKNKYEVINLAVPNFQIQEQIERFRIRGKKYNPDLIIWLLKDDDIEQINEIMMLKVMFYDHIVNKYKLSRFFEKLGDYYFSWTIARIEIEHIIGKKMIMEMQKKIIWELDNFYKGRLLVMTFDSTKMENKRFLKEYVMKRNLKYPTKYLEINLLPNEYYPIDGHPNINGHQKISTILFNQILF